MTRSRMIRAHTELCNVVDVISEQEKKSKTEATKILAMWFKTGRIRGNKRGNFLDMIAISVVILIFGIIILMGGFIFHSFNVKVQNMSTDIATPDAKATIGEMDTKFGSLWDGIFVFVLFGFILASLIGAYFVDSHPIFMVITLLVSLFLLIIGVIVNNVYAGISNNPIMYSYSLNFPMMNAIFNNFLVVLIAYLVLLMVSMYAGKRGEATA